MGFDVVRGAGCDADLDVIFDHLFGACRDFGDAPDAAFERAVWRIRGIEDDIPSLGNLPFQETLEPSILEDLGYVTKGRAVFYCLVNKRSHKVQVLGIFFGGLDHRQHMLERIKALAHGQSGGRDDPHA